MLAWIKVNELIRSGTNNLATKKELTALQRLQEEFAAELATLRGRVDALEARTAELEANQFSTTTKLHGEVIFALTDVLAGDNVSTRLPALPLDPITQASQGSRRFDTEEQSTVFANRVRLELHTSFTGTDDLKIRLVAGNSAHPPEAHPIISKDLNTAPTLLSDIFLLRIKLELAEVLKDSKLFKTSVLCLPITLLG
jgi:hypothetical protein